MVQIKFVTLLKCSLTCDLCDVTDIVTNRSQDMMVCDICNMSCDPDHVTPLLSN